MSKTGFIGHMYYGRLQQILDGVVNAKGFIKERRQRLHTTLVYMGKEYEDHHSDVMNRVPKDISCRVDGLDFIGRSLVMKLKILDKDKESTLRDIEKELGYPSAPFYHITLGRFNTWKDVDSFIMPNTESIEGFTFSISHPKLITVSQPNKRYFVHQ